MLSPDVELALEDASIAVDLHEISVIEVQPEVVDLPDSLIVGGGSFTTKVQLPVEPAEVDVVVISSLLDF